VLQMRILGNRTTGKDPEAKATDDIPF